MRGAKPGDIIAQCHGAICREAIDGAVWITHLKRKNTAKESVYTWLRSRNVASNFKLPAAMVLGHALKDVPKAPIDLLYRGSDNTFKEIWYEESDSVGYLHFDFHNGAMSTDQCLRLREAYQRAAALPTKVIVLMGARIFGRMASISMSSKRPITRPMNPGATSMPSTMSFMTSSTPRRILPYRPCGAGRRAGGAIMPLAADHVWARAGVVDEPPL